MLLHTKGVQDLHPTRTARLAHAATRRPRRTVRFALASALHAMASRLAPEMGEPPALRTRAAPN